MIPPRGGDDYSEDALVEQPAIALFLTLGWETQNRFHEFRGGSSTLGRKSERDVVLAPRLRAALAKLNPTLPAIAVDLAVEELTRVRSAMQPAEANREVYRLLKEGVKVPLRDADGAVVIETVTVIDWRNAEANDFLLTSQLWVGGTVYRRRCDLVGFVNGLPLLFIELKASHRTVKQAYDENFHDYQSSIPQIFWYNALVILSNGSESRAGSFIAPWDHFVEWKRINDEGETGLVSLETMIRGIADRAQLLDLVENFTLFEEGRGGLSKKIAKNHQFLGVNRAIGEVRRIRELQGRLGVFWHTQGSGKSLSMAFFAQKILRTIPGSWTFVIVTDRDELDGQIYGEFAAWGVVTTEEIHATSGAHLKELLRANHRYVFTLIQKFRTEAGKAYPMLSDRSDIIVIADEAHRSQYDTFALNMRTALPNAAFIGFTGTPLIAGEERTKDVFGDYVSIYDFKQSRDDGATVPLYYENRIPELQLTNEQLNDDIYAVVEEAGLDEAQEQRLEQEFARQYHLITREDRLETVAKDLVQHFASRGHLGKAMVVSIDKATAIRMYDKVRKHWASELERRHRELAEASEPEGTALSALIDWMATCGMAVVVSQSQNEVEEMRAKGLEILGHRVRMVNEDLAEKFKDPDDPLRLVFVCAMWMTGFDVPSCSTIYLDKPMKNHSLMQTIARANRRSPGKTAGLIVDYVGVFRNLQRALAVYAGRGGSESPVENKADLVAMLEQALAEVDAYCRQRDIDPDRIIAAAGFARVRLLDDAVEYLVENDAGKRELLRLAGNVTRIYQALLPDTMAAGYASRAVLYSVLAQKIRSLTPPADISAVMAEIEQVLDASIAAEGYVIEAASRPQASTEHLIDLSTIDFEALRERFAEGRRRTEVERLRGQLERKLTEMVRLNHARMNYLERFNQLIAEYNAGSVNVEELFDELVRLARRLTEEEQRGVREGLTEEELAVFDILTRPDPVLKPAERAEVKGVCRELLVRLKRELLVLEWRERQETRAAVRLAIEERLDTLPPAYDRPTYDRKCDRVFQHIYDSYDGEGRGIYVDAA